jgi:filamentous hemagglutinin family protein
MVLALAAAFADMVAAQSIPANTVPTGATVRAGTVSVGAPTVVGGKQQVTVTQDSLRALIDWTSANVGSNAWLNHVQNQGVQSITAHRVPGAISATVIDGMVTAPGNVMFLNSRGVMFGATASVNVAGLIASTGNIDQTQFMAGASFAISGANAGQVTNAGSITISDAGLAAFVAPSVANSGSIVAAGGRVVLGSADVSTVSFNGLYEIALTTGTSVAASITNTGTLSGDKIVISALDAANAVSGVINLEGILQANSIQVHGGQVFLSTDLDAASVAGTSRNITVCECGSIQDGVDIAASGANVTVDGGNHAEQVTLDKANLSVRGINDATVTIGAGQSAFTVAANGVTVEDMRIVGPYSQPYTAVNWSAQPDITSAVTINSGVSGATIRDNDIRNVRSGVLQLGSAPGTVITGNVIDNTKGSVLLRSSGATISANSMGPVGSEWDIVFLNGIADGAYFTSPHTSEALYGAGVMAMSAANNGMHILDRRYGSNGLLGSTPQFGNRSHLVVSAGSSFTAADDFNLGNGLGNARQPLGVLQAGIDAVVPGGFMDVKAGTYAVASTLNVDKALTLTGAGEADTLIDARMVSGYGMLVNADDVSLSHFTLSGPQANAGTSYGIKVQPAGSGAAARVHDFAISHVTSRGAGRAELDLNGVVGATIDHFTAQGDGTAGAGIQITDSANVTISNSVTTGNNWGGVALFQANRFFDQQVSNVTVQDNNSFAEALPLYMQDESASQNFGAVSLPGFDYAVRNSANGQYTWLHSDLGGALDIATAQATPAASTIQGWSGSASTQDFYVGSGMSIMKAVNEALPGAIVNVGAGLYAEQLTVTKSLTLAGAGATLVTVKPASLPSADANGARSILTIGGGADVEVSGFTFRGPVPELTAGIFVREGANANIHDNALIDARESVALSGNQRGIGIWVGRALFGTTGFATIANNTITGYQKGGILVDGPGSQATITGNTITGEGPTSVIAQNGIQASRGASATIIGNTVSGNDYTPASDEATGILIFTPGFYLGQGSITVGANNVSGNEAGVWTNDPATLSSISLSGVTGNQRNGVADFAGGFGGAGQFLEYPAWSASNTALVSASAFTGTQSGDMFALDGALRVSGWNGFAAIQPAIDAVANGGTVNVAAGTYAEDVTVSSQRNLLFSGATLQSLTVNAAGSGIGGSASANGGGFTFNVPVVLLGDTSLATTGGNITFNGDVQTAAGMAFALSLAAGTGNVSMVSGGSSTNPLGFLDVDANNFSLASTLWVTGYDIDALGDVTLSTSTLRSLGTSNAITAGGDVTGSTIAQGPVEVRGGDAINMNIVSTSDIFVEAPSSIVLNVETPTQLTLQSTAPVAVTGSAPEVTVSAPSGSITGNFSSVATTGGIIEVNGIPEMPQNLAGNFDVNRILPTDSQFAGNVGKPAPEEEDVYFETAQAERRGMRVVRGSPGSAGEALDQGMAVEIDLTPGYR